MAKTDYKFWYITRNDDGYITECAVRFYEGDITTEDEQTINGVVPVTRYRRTARLAESDLSHLGTGFVKEFNGADCKIYRSSDFGSITTDNQLRLFLNGELRKDPTRTPIAKQNTLDIQEVA